MKDKEKQIKSDCEKCIHDKVCYDCLMTDKCWGKDNDCKHYQPKLPEDSVVLSKEEYEKLKHFEHRVRSGVCMTQKEWFDCDLYLSLDALKLITELEKENETKTDTITDLLKKQEFYEKEKLTKFAERLKDEIGDMKQFFRSCLDRDYCGLTEDQIDETLKEFINE